MSSIDWLSNVRETNNLLPWEPVITRRDVFEFSFTPDDMDTCDSCGCALGRKELMVSNNGGSNFCNWDCLIRQARKYPEFYHIDSLGAWE